MHVKGVEGRRGASRGRRGVIECVECVECVEGRGGVEGASRVLRYCATVLWSVDDVGVGVVLCIYGIGWLALLHSTLLAPAGLSLSLARTLH